MAVPNQKSQGPLPPEEREKLKEKVINQVRAVLLPEKHGMLLDNLNSKYINALSVVLIGTSYKFLLSVYSNIIIIL